MRRLYLQIYLVFVGVLLLFAALMAAVWWLMPDGPREPRMLDGIAGLVAEALPPTAPPADMQRRLAALRRRYPADISVFGADRAPLASIGEAMPPPPPDFGVSGWLRVPGMGPVTALRLDDGRVVMVRSHHRPPVARLLTGIVLLSLALAAGAYPLARRLTGRLERLQSRVDALGAGDLSARVEVEGNDEVAELAKRFNHTAGRIEQLVGAQRTMLANVSHELRSPLARMRMATELLGAGERPDLKARLARDIAELDALIDELLLASRLDGGAAAMTPEPVELLSLAAEEAAEFAAEVSGAAVTIDGDVRTLRRPLRNLLQNARRYAGETPIEVMVIADGGGAVITVADRGPGVPVAEQERIFEPFYRLPGTRESGDGVGLGLALVRQIARRHAGEVTYSARDGGGSVFRVALGGLIT